MNSSIANVILPELGAIGAAGATNRRLVTLILAASALFCVVVGVAVFVILGKEAKSARHGATSFASALVHNDPSIAPQGAAGNVAGVRAYFGPVSGATVIATHNHSVRTGNSADTRSYFVADVLLATKRGPAVLELSFDNHSLGSLTSEEVTSIRELSPGDAPSLPATDRAKLKAAFAARGGQPAPAAMLSGSVPIVAPAAPSVTAKHVVPHAHPAVSTATKQLRCVQRAHGDVAKLAACA